MKRLILTAALLSSLVFAASAQAATSVTATLATPVTKEMNLIAGHGVFRCIGSTCQLASEDSVSIEEACRDLKRQVGPISQISTPTRQLEADRLAKCNAK
jgi:hypothetical protein